jgi:hypothetical protein
MDAREIAAAADTLGPAGGRALQRMYNSIVPASDYYDAFARQYEAARNGREAAVGATPILEPAQIEAAREAGRADAAQTGQQTAQGRTEQRTGRAAVYDAAVSLGEDTQGAAALYAQYRPEQDSYAYIDEMTRHYDSGLTGAPYAPGAGAGGTLTETQARAAYEAGIEDGRTRTNGRANESRGRGQGQSSDMASTRQGSGLPGGEGQGISARNVEAARLRSAVKASGAVAESTAAQGISAGTNKKTLLVVSSKLWSKSMRDTSRRMGRLGVHVTYFTGTLELREGTQTFTARGALSKDGKRMWVRADHPGLTPEQIARHEEYHALARKDKSLVRETRDKIVAKYTNEELNAVIAQYSAEYGLAGMNAEYVVEEILADAYAGIEARVAVSQFADITRERAADVEFESGPVAGTEDRFSPVGRTENDRPVAVIETDIFSGVPERSWVMAIKNAFRSRYPQGVQIANSDIRINSQSLREIFNSEYSKQLKRAYPLIFKDKLRAAAIAGDVLRAAENWVNEGLHHKRRDNIIAFARGSVLLRVGENDYTAEVIVGNKRSGNMLLYDIISLRPIENLGKIKYSAGTKRDTSSKSGFDYTLPTNAVFDTSVPQGEEVVKGEREKFSLDEPVEEKRNLIAVHNLHEEDLRGALELGGMPSPSIAIVKAQHGRLSSCTKMARPNWTTCIPQTQKNSHSRLFIENDVTHRKGECSPDFCGYFKNGRSLELCQDKMSRYSFERRTGFDWRKAKRREAG